MADAGFFKGTSAEQDSRFANKQKKLLKQMKFPDNVDVKIDMLKVNMDVIKPWLTGRLQELLGIEDDVVIEFVFNQLEDKNPDPKMMQINLTGFLGGSKARLFIGELWNLLASAQTSPDGIPAELVEMKKKELLKRKEDEDRLREIRKREEESYRQDVKPDIHKFDNKPNARQAMSSANSKPRHENGNTAGYKSRAHYDDDRRRFPPKAHRARGSRSPEARSRRSDKKINEDDRQPRHEKQRENPKSTSSRYRSPSKSPSHSRSPLKSTRQSPPREIEKSEEMHSSPSIISVSPPRKEVRDVSDDRNGTKSQKSNENKHPSSNEPLISKKKRKSPTPSPSRSKPTAKKGVTSKIKALPTTNSKKEQKRSRHDRSTSSSSSSTLRSNSKSSVSSSSSFDSEMKKKKKQKKKSRSSKRKSSSRSRSPSPDRRVKSSRKREEHKSTKHSDHHSLEKYSKWEPVNLDRPDRSTTRNESPSRTVNARDEKKTRRSQQASAEDETPKLSTPPKKPRLESQIRMQTPPPSSKSTNDNKLQTSTPTKPNRTERIVLLDESRTDDISSVPTRVCVTSKTVYDGARSQNVDNVNMNNSSGDENEIDLRERLLREKAIKSMRRRQLSNPSANNVNTKATTSDQVVYDSP